MMTEELINSEIRINKSAGRGDSDSRMTSFEVIMPLEFQSTMKAHGKMRYIAPASNS